MCCMLYSKDKGTILDKHDEENSKEKIQRKNREKLQEKNSRQKQDLYLDSVIQTVTQTHRMPNLMSKTVA